MCLQNIKEATQVGNMSTSRRRLVEDAQYIFVLDTEGKSQSLPSSKFKGQLDYFINGCLQMTLQIHHSDDESAKYYKG